MVGILTLTGQARDWEDVDRDFVIICGVYHMMTYTHSKVRFSYILYFFFIVILFVFIFLLLLFFFVKIWATGEEEAKDKRRGNNNNGKVFVRTFCASVCGTNEGNHFRARI